MERFEPARRSGKPRQFMSWFERWMPGLASLRSYQTKYLKHDITAGLTVFAVDVAAPIAYAELAHVSPVNGLYAVLAAFLAYGIFGSARNLMLGHESAISILTGTIVLAAAGSDPSIMPLVAAALAILVGIFSLAFGLLKMGWLADLMSEPILKGYMIGIGMTIVLTQLGKFLGFSTVNEEFVPLVIELVGKLPQTVPLALGVGATSLVVLYVLKAMAPRWPRALIVLVLAIAASTAFDFAGRGVAVLGALPRGLPSLRVPSVSWEVLAQIFVPALVLVLIAYADTILSGRIVAAKDERVRDNQEFIAIGAGNVLSGLVGGFPVTGSTSTTTLEKAVGGKTHAVHFIAAAAVALFLMFFSSLLAALPKPTLAAIIIQIGIGLIDFKAVQSIARVVRSDAWLAGICATGVLLLGIMQGVLIAVLLSFGVLVYRMSRPKVDELGVAEGSKSYHLIKDKPQHTEPRTPGLLVLRFDAPLVFSNARYFKDTVTDSVAAASQEVRCLILDMAPVTQIDTSGIETLRRLTVDLKAAGTYVWLARVDSRIKALLVRGEAIDAVGKEHVYPSVRSAVAAFSRGIH